MPSLAEFPARIVSLPNASRRRQTMARQFSALGISHRFIDGVRGVGKIRGAARGHAAAFDDIGQAPFMVFEDDVELLAADISLPAFPVGADAVYLGTNTDGCLPNRDPYPEIFGHRSIPGFALASRHDANWLRLHSMVSAHAILFLSDRAYSAYRRELTIAGNRKTPLDVRYAYLMRELNVFTPHRPVFAEALDLQPVEKRDPARMAITRTPLTLRRAGDALRGEKRGLSLVADVVDLGDGRLDWQVARIADAASGSLLTQDEALAHGHNWHPR